MNKINLEEIISDRIRIIKSIRPKKLSHLLFSILERILYVKKINSFLEEFSHYDTIQLINTLFEHLNFNYLTSPNELERIPQDGKVICVANHPIGSLDGLALLKIFLEVRDDVKIIANDVLYYFHFLKPYLLPVDIFSTKNLRRDYLTAINESLKNNQALIIFPAASVSRLNWYRIIDSKWHKAAVSLARKHHSSILPVYIDAKNSLLFYLVSLLNKNLSTLLLAHELFNKTNRSIRIKIGNLIPAHAFTHSYIDDSYQTRLLRKHVYLMGKRNKTIFRTENSIIHPVDRSFIKRELNSCEFIGLTNEDMTIYLANKKIAPFTLNEVARLREKTFRSVGEGTGKKMDIDRFDEHYYHIIVWDNKHLEIVGAYRVGVGSEILKNQGINGFYTSTLFKFSEKFIIEYLNKSIELGRSFVQRKYWTTNALNYLWQGIGAFIAVNPEIRFLFGGVSISNSYPEYAKKLIVYYYKKWFSHHQELIESKNKFSINAETLDEFKKIFIGGNAKNDYLILKGLLKQMNCSVPILFKHYSELCEEGGVIFSDFGVDPNFFNCIDGLIIVDLYKLKESKKVKYIRTKNDRLKVSA